MAYADSPHKNGRPARAASPTTHQISVRFTDEELAALTAHAEARAVPRVVLIRAAMERCKLFDPDADLPRLNY